MRRWKSKATGQQKLLGFWVSHSSHPHMDLRHTGEILSHLEKQNELLLEARESMSHELHVLQAAFAPKTNLSKDEKEPGIVKLAVLVDGKETLLGYLTSERPQMLLNSLFEREFQLVHDLKCGEVSFAGNKIPMPKH